MNRPPHSHGTLRPSVTSSPPVRPLLPTATVVVRPTHPQAAPQLAWAFDDDEPLATGECSPCPAAPLQRGRGGACYAMEVAS